MNTSSFPLVAADVHTGGWLSRMMLADLEEVLELEQAEHAHPWTRGNFLDSLQNAYEAWVLRAPAGDLLGYLLMMLAVEEAHVLNVTVAGRYQGKGWGRALLDQAAQWAREKGMASLLLEVRPSNVRALALYERYGFLKIGMRKNYYPALHGRREDALVMRLSL